MEIAVSNIRDIRVRLELGVVRRFAGELRFARLNSARRPDLGYLRRFSGFEIFLGLRCDGKFYFGRGVRFVVRPQHFGPFQRLRIPVHLVNDVVRRLERSLVIHRQIHPSWRRGNGLGRWRHFPAKTGEIASGLRVALEFRALLVRAQFGRARDGLLSIRHFRCLERLHVLSAQVMIALGPDLDLRMTRFERVRSWNKLSLVHLLITGLGVERALLVREKYRASEAGNLAVWGLINGNFGRECLVVCRLRVEFRARFCGHCFGPGDFCESWRTPIHERLAVCCISIKLHIRRFVLAQELRKNTNEILCEH